MGEMGAQRSVKGPRNELHVEYHLCYTGARTCANKEGPDLTFLLCGTTRSSAGLACQPLMENLVEGGEGVPPVSDDVPAVVRELSQPSLVSREPCF